MLCTPVPPGQSSCHAFRTTRVLYHDLPHTQSPEDDRKVGIIGAGNVGSAFARRVSAAGHDVLIASRDMQEAEQVAKSIEEQTEQTLRNVEAILQAAGSALDRVLQMTIYVSDIELWGGVNATYARVMGTHRPARAVVPVKDLHYGYQIEIQVIAATSA